MTPHSVTSARIAIPQWALGVGAAASGHPVTIGVAMREWWMYMQLPEARRNAYRRAAEILRTAPRTRENVVRVAKLLDQAQFRDLSIRILLRHRCVTEAAALHLKHGARALAAQLYAQNGHWKKAGAIFVQDGDYVRAGHCAMQLGLTLKAARLFRKAGHMRAAAKCYVTVGDRRQAALVLGIHGDFELAKNMYESWLNKEAGASQAILSDEEVKVMVEIVRTQEDAQSLVRLLNSNGHSSLLLKRLLENDRLGHAVEIFKADPTLHRERLFKWLDDQPFHSQKVMQLFQVSGDNEGLGRLMEYLGVWEEAADAYQKAGRYESAYECSLKSGDFGLVEKCRSLLPTLTRSPETLPSLPISVQVSKSPLPPRVHGAIALAPVLKAKDLTVPEPARLNFEASHFFAEFAGDEKELLWRLGTIRQYRVGEIIVDYGEKPVGTFTVLSGALAFEKRTGHPGVSHELCAATNIGEAWSVLSLPSSVRIHATEACELHIMERARVSEWARQAARPEARLYDRLSDRVMRHLLERAAEPLIENLPVLAI